MESSCTPPETYASKTGTPRPSRKPTDAVIRLAASCICGSDLWPYRGSDEVDATPMATSTSGGHRDRRRGGEREGRDFVVGSFMASDNTCEICQAGYQSRCVHVVPMGRVGTQAEFARIPLADGTLVATPGQPDDDLIPSLLAARTCSAPGGSPRSRPRSVPARRWPWSVTVPSGCSASWPRSSSVPERIIAMSRHADRQELARRFGAHGHRRGAR